MNEDFERMRDLRATTKAPPPMPKPKAKLVLGGTGMGFTGLCLFAMLELAEKRTGAAAKILKWVIYALLCLNGFAVACVLFKLFTQP